MLKNYLVTIATSLGLPLNFCQFCNPHTCVRLKADEDRSSSCWDVWSDMLIFAVSSKKVQLLPSQSLGLVDRMSPKLYTMYRNSFCLIFWNWNCELQSVFEWQRDKGDWSVKNADFRLFSIFGILEDSEKEAQIGHIRTNTYRLVQRSRTKIGPVDPETFCSHLKKKEKNASKIYSPIGKFAVRAKWQFAFFVTRSICAFRT